MLRKTANRANPRVPPTLVDKVGRCDASTTPHQPCSQWRRTGRVRRAMQRGIRDIRASAATHPHLHRKGGIHRSPPKRVPT